MLEDDKQQLGRTSYLASPQLAKEVKKKERKKAHTEELQRKQLESSTISHQDPDTFEQILEQLSGTSSIDHPMSSTTDRKSVV